MSGSQPSTNPTRSARSPAANKALKLALIAQGSLGAPSTLKSNNNRPKDSRPPSQASNSTSTSIAAGSSKTRGGAVGGDESNGDAASEPSAGYSRCSPPAEPHQYSTPYQPTAAPLNEATPWGQQHPEQPQPSPFQPAQFHPAYHSQPRSSSQQQQLKLPAQPQTLHERTSSQTGHEPHHDNATIGTASDGVMSGQNHNFSALTAKSHAQQQNSSAASSQTTLAQPLTQADGRRPTPQSTQSAEDMTADEASQLAKDHKELRDKYIKVKKYYFEKEDQVKQLQNSLANQRLAQSRTSLDDSEYSTRFSRLDGLIAQLAFSVRKSWNTVPNWLSSSVNKDAIATGKQEMTAAGRAFISCWLVEEVFEKYFHPDLETNFSVQLKAVQKNIRRSSPTPQSADEDAAISSRVTNWRLSTLDGLRETLQSPQAPANRAQLIDLLNKHLIGSLIVHLQDPPMSDLQGGVQMIIELAVSIATHLPLESRDVQVDYYMPGEQFNDDLMRQETGIPPLDVSVAEDAGKKGHGQFKNMLRFNGPEEDGVSRVRMAVGIGAHVRFKTTLVKAPVHGV